MMMIEFDDYRLSVNHQTSDPPIDVRWMSVEYFLQPGAINAPDPEPPSKR